mmetsp:Transcript_4739/g.12623  ORF Transcript_4739/g.12623 Transcript_4739/m.12623 type:complete len:222 (-) Transcript_4739:214-879(-)
MSVLESFAKPPILAPQKKRLRARAPPAKASAILRSGPRRRGTIAVTFGARAHGGYCTPALRAAAAACFSSILLAFVAVALASRSFAAATLSACARALAATRSSSASRLREASSSRVAWAAAFSRLAVIEASRRASTASCFACSLVTPSSRTSLLYRSARMSFASSASALATDSSTCTLAAFVTFSEAADPLAITRFRCSSRRSSAASASAAICAALASASA